MNTKPYYIPHTSTANEFIQLAECMATSNGSMSGAAEAAKRPYVAKNVENITQRAAVSTDMLADHDYRRAADAFAETLIGESVFETILQSAIEVPLKTNVAVQGIAGSASLVAEGKPAPVTLASFANVRLDPVKIVALLAVTDEVLRSTYSFRFVRAALRHAVIQAQDGALLNGIVGTGDIVAGSAGAGAANALKDIRAALLAVNIAGARPFIVMDSKNAVAISTFDGTPFAQATPQGGLIAGVPYLVCDQVGSDSSGTNITAIDAASMLMSADPIALDTSIHASLNMTTAPEDEAENLVSMFQTNSTALRLKRLLGFESVRAGAVAVITGAAW